MPNFSKTEVSLFTVCLVSLFNCQFDRQLLGSWALFSCPPEPLLFFFSQISFSINWNNYPVKSELPWREDGTFCPNACAIHRKFCARVHMMMQPSLFLYVSFVCFHCIFWLPFAFMYGRICVDWIYTLNTLNIIQINL